VKTNNLILPILLSISTFGCSGKKQVKDNSIDSLSVQSNSQTESQEIVVKDTLLDYQGRFIAGLSQIGNNSFSALENDHYWKDYKNTVDTSWTNMYNSRLSKIKQWEAEIFSATVNDSLPLFYPFSGPDFLHAHYLYPSTQEFILGALEPIIDIPLLNKVKEKNRDKFLDSLHHSLRDIFKKSYFITTHMQNDLKQIRGVLPALYFFIERTGHELLEQKFIGLDKNGNIRELTENELRKRIPAVKIKFRDVETQAVKTLYYFNLDLSDKGLSRKPEFLKFASTKAPFNTFLKSASYLLTNPTFSMMRSFILTNAKSLFQDDTGVPYRFLKNRMDLNVTLFGEYIKPVSSFGSYTYQPDLDSAYKTANKKPLPFSLGYHWSTKIQNYMLVTKSPAKNPQK
jgi:hypothetical protein